MRMFIGLCYLGIAMLSPLLGEEPPQNLFNVAKVKYGASASGSGSKFNKDWPPINCLNNGKKAGTIFGGPLTGGRIDIHLIIPCDIEYLEISGINYSNIRIPKGIDIYYEGTKVGSTELPFAAGKMQRVDIKGEKIQNIGLVVTSEHERFTDAKGKLGATWGGFGECRVFSTTNVPELMKQVDQYQITRVENYIAPTAGALTKGKVEVFGEPRVSENHPKTLWDEQDIQEYKDMLKTSVKLQQAYAGLKKSMDLRMEMPLGIPQPQKDEKGNWLHLFKVGNIHDQLGLDIANLGTIYQLSGEEKYGEFAKKLLLAYADAHPHYGIGAPSNFKHDPSKVFDQRLGDATWLIQVARGYDLIYNLPSITTEERQHIEEDLVKGSARHIIKNGSVLRAPTNWSSICIASILMAGVATDDEELIQIAMYGPGGTAEKPTGGLQLHFSSKCIDVDGMWSEGAMGYQFMAMEALVCDAEVLWHRGIDMYRNNDASFKRLFDSPIEFSNPNLKTPAINDSGYVSIVGREAFLYEYGYRRYRDPRYLMILNKSGMFLDAQFQKFAVSRLWDRDEKAEIPPIEWKSVNLFGVGYGILRHTNEKGTVSALIDYGPDRSHGHPDKLNLDLYAHGERLIPDPGIVFYTNPMYKGWYYNTIAHNTLSVDEMNQLRCAGEQLVYAYADSFSLQRHRTDGAFSGVMMDRSLFQTPDYTADMFGAFAKLDRTLDLSYHFDAKLVESDLPLEAFTMAESLNPGYNTLAENGNPCHGKKDESWIAQFDRKGKTYRFVAGNSKNTEVIFADGYMGMSRPPCIIQRRKTNQTIFGNAIDLSLESSPFVKSVQVSGSLDEGFGFLTVQTKRGQDLCFASFRTGTFSYKGLETDAQQAFILRNQDQVVGMFLGGGNFLTFQGHELRLEESGLAYIEKTNTGAFIVGNPSPNEAKLWLKFPLEGELLSHTLDLEGRPISTSTITKENSSYVFSLKPGQRLELAPKSQMSTFEYRQNMLLKRQKEAAAELARVQTITLARTKLREEEAAKNPVTNVVNIIQAEDFTGEGGGKVGISTKKRAIIGAAFSGWNGTGHWLEYKVTVPQEGYYHLHFVYCTELNFCERKVEINGEEQEPEARLNFPSTGGWANGSDDWRLYTSPNDLVHHPLLYKFKAGENVIRLTNTGGEGVNMDYFAVTSPDIAVSRELLAEKATLSLPTENVNSPE